jgi:hypothetical protein
MFRKLLAGLLVVSWVILSGFDLLEDLKLPTPLQIDASPASLPATKPRLHAVNDIVESADGKSESDASMFALQSADVAVCKFADFKKVSRLHKLHRVYLI